MNNTLTSWSKTHKKWTDDFVIELRLADVPGSRIGDELATVQAHCEETGESPEKAFGSAKEYAQSLGYSLQESTGGEYLAASVPVLLQVLVMLPLTSAVIAWVQGHNFTMNIVQVLGSLGIVLLIVATLSFLKIRTLIEKPWVLMGAMVPVVGLGLLTAFSAQWDVPTLIDTDPLPVVIIGVVLMITLTLWGLKSVSRDNVEEDLVISPLATSEEKSREKHQVRWIQSLPLLLIPVATLLESVAIIALV